MDQRYSIEMLNLLDIIELKIVLNSCCSCNKWIHQMIANRPFKDINHLLLISNSIEKNLSNDDWKEAFHGHPKIGEQKHKILKEYESQEQNGMKEATDIILNQFEILNNKYYDKFGYIYIVNATNKTAKEMLNILIKRLENEPNKEIINAFNAQSEITKMRLQKFFY